MKVVMYDLRMAVKVGLAMALILWAVLVMTGCASTSKVDTFDEVIKELAPTFFKEEVEP